ncbi:MAG: hypothetical protein ABIP97_09695 [Chthoniobacterales bacterium]
MRLTILFCLLAFAPLRAVDAPRRLSEAVQDDAGIAWANDTSDNNTLYSFDGKTWQVAHLPFAQNASAYPILLKRSTIGDVICLWKLPDDKLALSRHHGKESKLFGLLPTPPFSSGVTPCVLEDSRRQLWITGGNLDIVRVSPDGKASVVYKIPTEQLTNIRYQKREGVTSIVGVEDGLGRIWFYATEHWSNWAYLRGILLADGDKIESLDLPIAKGKCISAILRKDDDHLWVGICSDNLYEVNIHTLEAKPVGTPNAKVFGSARHLFAIGEDFYLIAKENGKASLWRLRDAKWSRIIDAINDNYPNQVLYQMPNGFILSSIPYSWFVSHTGSAKKFDWRTGCPVEQLKSICKFLDGSFLVVGRTFYHGKISLPPMPAVTNIAELELETPAITDLKGNVWILSKGPKRSLKQWTGKRWIVHALPSVIGDDAQIYRITPDTKGRIWIWFRHVPPIAVFYDSATKKWNIFPTELAGFEALKDDPPKFSDAQAYGGLPIYSKTSKRIAFRKGWEVAYFDGEKWRSWKRADILAGKQYTLGRPFFDEADHLCVNIEGKTWQFDGENKWTETKWQNPFPQDPFNGTPANTSTHNGVQISVSVRPPQKRPKLPKNDLTNSPSSVVLDNQNNYWFMWERQLFKYVDGACIQIFENGEPNPFASNPYLQKVFVDQNDNAFFSVAASTGREFMIPTSSMPKTGIAIESILQDSAKIRFHFNSRSKVLYHWKLDAGLWQQTRGNHITLNYLSNGSHTLKVFAYNENSHSSSLSSEKKFEIKIDSTKQITRLTALLFGKDYSSREEAVAALASQPQNALAVLQKARETANDLNRWWIDATIQEIEYSKMRKARASEPVKN